MSKEPLSQVKVSATISRDLPPGWKSMEDYLRETTMRMTPWQRIRYEWARLKLRWHIWRWKRAGNALVKHSQRVASKSAGSLP